MQAIPMTLRGAEKLREELDFLKSVRRPEIIAAIAEAREHGDLKENAWVTFDGTGADITETAGVILAGGTDPAISSFLAKIRP